MGNFKSIFLSVSISVLLFLAMLETSLHLFPVISDQFGEWDDELWIHHIANKSGIYVNCLGERIKVKINSDGFRDYEFSLKKDDSILRILMFGDSFIASLMSPQNETAPKYLERFLNTPKILNKLNCSRVEVYNLGVSGYSFSTYFLLLNKTIKKYKPDIVIFNPFLGNDITQTIPPKTNITTYPVFDLINGSLTYKKINSKPFIYSFREKFWFLFPKIQLLIYRTVRSLLSKSKTESLKIYEKNNEEISKTWEIIGKILNASKELCAEHNASFYVFSLTQPEQLYKDWREKVLEKYHGDASQLDFTKPDKDLLRTCRKYNITCFSTLDDIKKLVAKYKRRTTPLCDGHYYSHGNKMHAQIIVKYLFES